MQTTLTTDDTNVTTDDTNDHSQNNEKNDNDNETTIVGGDGTPNISINNCNNSNAKAEGEGGTDVMNDDMNTHIDESNKNQNNDDATTENNNVSGDGTRDTTNDDCNSNATGEGDTEEESGDATLRYLKQKFDEVLKEIIKGKRANNITITAEQYSNNLTLVRNWVPNIQGRPRIEYKIQEKYVAVAGSHETALRLRPKDGNNANANIKVATVENMFDIIHKAHRKLGHPRGSRSQYTHIKGEWYGITEEFVKVYIGLCPTCASTRRKITAKQRPLKMILSETIGKRAQMDLIDMSSQQDPDGYKWILRLIDHLSGHGHVRPLFTKTALECGTAIIQILSSSIDFDILQSDNGGEFLGKTIELVNK